MLLPNTALASEGLLLGLFSGQWPWGVLQGASQCGGGH